MNAEENKPVEYNSKTYTKYEATQRQRRLETTMRAQRQKIKLLEEGGADEQAIINARARYVKTSDEYVNFSKSVGLSKQWDRVTVGSNTVKGITKPKKAEMPLRGIKSADDGKIRGMNSNKHIANSSKGDILKEESKERFSGRYSANQERIDQLIQDDLSGINFTEKPVYNSRIRSNGKTTVREFADGTVKEVVKVEIGKQDNSSAEFLEDSILHEELEARIAIRSRYSKRYKELYKSNDDERHRYINRVIERYFKIKGWNYELATN